MSYNAVSAAQVRRFNLSNVAREAEQYKAQRHFLDFARKVPLPLQGRFLDDPDAFAESRLPTPGLLIKPGKVSKFEEINMSKGDFSQYLAYDKLAERENWDFEIASGYVHNPADRNNLINQLHGWTVNGTVESLGVVDYKTTRHRFLKDTSNIVGNRLTLNGGATHMRTGDVFDVEHWQNGLGQDVYRVINRTTEASRLQSKGIAVDWAGGIPTIGGGHKKKYSGKKRGRKPKSKAVAASE